LDAPVQHDEITRRGFLATVGSVGGLWLLGDALERREALDHARHQAGSAQPTLAYFTREQAAEIEAMTARIIPTDSTPGAREAGVVYFIDKSLTTFAKGQQGLFTEGLKQLATAVQKKVRGQNRLAALTPAQQDDVLRSIERTPFFQNMRFATLTGMLALPSYGGNRDWAGWKLVGQDVVQDYKPPFGYYDDPRNRTATGRSGT
jgi:gluconate 2-dehydrogenase gamma chain